MGTLFLALLLGCGPSEADIDARITERLLAEKLIEPPKTTSREPTAPTPHEPASVDPSAATHAFLARLDALMKDYQPDLPAVADDTDVLRCVTSDQLKGDTRLKDLGRTLEKQRQAAERARRDAAMAFRREQLPLNYRVDFGWAGRIVVGTPAIYGCWDSGRNEWLDAGDARSGPSLCTGRWKWKVQREASPSRAIYADGAPELMKRIDAAHVAVPERISCRINDVVPRDDHRTIDCEGGPEIRVYGDGPVSANVGDIVSVPIRDVKRDPNGVLWKDIAAGGWVVDADVAAVKVDEAATCPTIDDILASGAMP